MRGATATEAAVAGGLCRTYTQKLIAAMQLEGCAVQEGMSKTRGPEAKRWRVKLAEVSAPTINNIPSVHSRMAKLIWALLTPTYTCQELAEFSGLNRKTVYAFIKSLETEKLAYVSRWHQQPGGAYLAIYGLSLGRKSVKSPGPQTSAQRYAKKQALRAAATSDPLLSIWRIKV